MKSIRYYFYLLNDLAEYNCLHANEKKIDFSYLDN